MIEIDGFLYRPSTNPKFKLDAIDTSSGTVTPFGATGYQHYFDRTGILDKKLNHLDKTRRENYIKRHSKILDKYGRQVMYIRGTAAWHSRNILW